MSRRAHIRQHLERLAEIGEIMRAMKNVAVLETHKLARFLEHQQGVLAGIEAAFEDFLRHYVPDASAPQAEPELVLAIGAERGFCGEFNEAVAAAVRARLAEGPARVVIVGRRLAAKLEGAAGVVATIEGPNVVEEVPNVLGGLSARLIALHEGRTERAPLSLTVFAHGESSKAVCAQRLSAQSVHARATSREAYPPLLTLAAPELHRELTRHYLWAQLHHLFFSSLMAENRARLQHMEGAIQRMEETAAELAKRQNILRQEEITEEIEVIMLSTGFEQAPKPALAAHAGAP